MSEMDNGQPSGWVRTTLSEVISASGAKAEPGNLGDVPYIGLEHIEGGSNRILSIGRITDIKSTKSIFQRGDVLYGKLRPYLKKVCRPDFDGVCSTDILVFPESSNIDNGYLLYFLSQQSTADYATQNSNGINLPRISSRVLGEIEFPLPPLAEQHRIVDKIEALQERNRRAREALSEVEPLLDQFRRSLLIAAFRGDLTADWRADHPNDEFASELLRRIRADVSRIKTRRGVPKDVPFPDHFSKPLHPSSWYLASVGDLLHHGMLIDVKDGNHGANHPRTSEFSPEGLPFITASQVFDYHVDYETAPKVSGEPLAKLRVGFAEVGDVVLTHKGTVGRTAINTKPCVLTPQTTYYRCQTEYMDPTYLMYYLSSPTFQEQLVSVMSQTTRNFVPISEQYRLFLVVPPIDEQRAIAAILNASFGQLRELARPINGAYAQLDQLDQAILAKAFHGELVPQDPTDEPASMLLERIGAQRKQQAEAPKQTSKSHRTSKSGKKSPRLEPQQLTLAEVLRTCD